MKIMRRVVAFVLLIAVVLGVAVATNMLPTSSLAFAFDDFFGDEEEDNRPVIVLGQDAWIGARANNAVVKILLERELGYRVEIVEINDHEAMAQSLIKGDVVVMLEKWNSTMSESYRRYLNAGIIEDLGPLGVVAKSAWYVPTYVAEEYPEVTTWEGLNNPEIVELFSTPGTGSRGRLLSGNPVWNVHLEQLIDNLELNYQVVYAGSEEEQLVQIDEAYQNQEPILFYLWSPHTAHLKYDLTEVELPPYSDECYAQADAGGINCGYPEDVIIKVANPRLHQTAPDAYNLFQNFRFPSSEIKMDLLAAVDGSETMEDMEVGAHRWLAEHEDVWRAWLEEDDGEGLLDF